MLVIFALKKEQSPWLSCWTQCYGEYMELCSLYCGHANKHSLIPRL